MGIGTKSQQALQMQREESKLVRKVLSRKQREEEKQRQFELKQQKAKGKASGQIMPLCFYLAGFGAGTPQQEAVPKGQEIFKN